MTVTSEREGEGLDCLGWDCDWDWAVEVGSKTSPGSGSEPSNNKPHSMDGKGKGNLMETNQPVNGSRLH